MATRYSYSYDRNTFYGSYPSRQEAYHAALNRMNSLTDQPEAVYTAERVQPNLQNTGHAGALVREMRERAELQCGEQAIDWLRNVPGKDIADLDEMLAQTIGAWLRKHEYQPTFFMVQHIAETAPLAEVSVGSIESMNESECSA